VRPERTRCCELDCGAAGVRAVRRPLTGMPTAAPPVSGLQDSTHAVAPAGRQDVLLDAPHEQRVGGLLSDEALQVAVARHPLAFDDPARLVARSHLGSGRR
jgi:hypothetical protein